MFHFERRADHKHRLCAPRAACGRCALAALAFVGLLSGGCAAPRTFPAAPLSNHATPGGLEREYDLDADGTADFREQVGPNGRIRRLDFREADGWREVVWPQGSVLPGAAAPANDRGTVPHLLIVLDSVPFDIAQQVWESGRLRLFAPPSRHISVFPAMTDPALADVLHVSPCRAVEANYYDGQRLREGMDAYVATENAPWWPLFDYTLDAGAHAFQYLDPWPWFRHELGRIEQRFLDQPRDFMAYCVGTSGLGSKYGADAHVQALILVDRFCQSLVQRTAGRVRITLLSDHGHDLRPARRISLREGLAGAGYRVRSRLEGPDDVVIPEFGQVTCAAVHTRSPARVARDLVQLEGVDLAMYRVTDAATDPIDAIVIVSRHGSARLSGGPETWLYEVTAGSDPLRLDAALGSPAADARRRALGDADLFTATLAHDYPDPLRRIWAAFHGQHEIVPDVLVSIAEGYYVGSADLHRWMKMVGVHGNLARAGTTGFVMTTQGPLPAALRSCDVAAALRVLGVHLRTGDSRTRSRIEPTHAGSFDPIRVEDSP